MRVICAGWWRDKTKSQRVHDAPVVLWDDGDDEIPSHGICPACKDAFIALLPPKKEATQ